MMIRRKKVFGALIISVLLLVIARPSRYVNWIGGFPQAEFQIKITDPHGNAIEGVRLRVENEQGQEAFNFPVSDYSAQQTPKSDPNGNLVFHHVECGVEFSGQCRYLFFFIPVDEGKCQMPVFICRFLYNEKSICTIRFNDLAFQFPNSSEGLEAWKQLPKIKRRWVWPSSWPADFPEHLKPINVEEQKEVEFTVIQETISVNIP